MASFEVVALPYLEKESKEPGALAFDEEDTIWQDKHRYEADFLCMFLTSVCIFAAFLGFHDGSIFETYQAIQHTKKISFPSALVGRNGLYEENDFINHRGVKVPYWEDVFSQIGDDEELKFEINSEKSHFRTAVSSNTTSFYLSVTPEKPAVIPHFGPCYLPSNNYEEHTVQLRDLQSKNVNVRSASNIKFPEFDPYRPIDDNTNLCRPGFIIIGAGKCGTSSLYHYLAGHPRVLPAKEKQVHYFKNATHFPMSWYLSHFPSYETFLSHGALMTGEASPGYLPRPDVAFELQDMMRNLAGNGRNADVSTPKIITAVRNPLERSWSSYKYNYANPGLEQVKKENPMLSTYMSDKEISEKYLFTFEQMIRAELDLLKECLQPGGIGEQLTKLVHGHKPWARTVLERKDSQGMPLIAIDEACYGGIVSPTLPRRQWKDLVEEFPEKLINVDNLHTVQAMVGRSLFTLPMEWWYEFYPKDDLYMVCNEDLKYHGSEELSKISDFLGLPAFDFSDVVNEGMFNVGNNIGYDTVTRVKVDEKKEAVDVYSGIPISEELKEDYLSFVKPFNERLFELAGKRCDW